MNTSQMPPNDVPQANNSPSQSPTAGTIPPPAAPKAAPPPPGYTVYPAPAVKQRRVGTFTLGLTLILIGIMVPLCMIFREQTIRWFQFAPVVLVFLGVEVLYYAIRYKEGKLRYDGVSIFLVLMLTVVSVITASIASYVSKYADYYSDLERNQMAFEDTVEGIMNENGYVSDGVGYYYSGNYNSFFRIMNYADDSAGFWVNASVSMISDTNSPAEDEVVSAFYNVASALAARGDFEFRTLDMSINTPSGYNPHIHLSKYQLENLSKENIRKWTNMNQPEAEVIDDPTETETAGEDSTTYADPDSAVE